MLHSHIRRTKIIATIGPASEKPRVLEAMIQAGVNVVRINFSHGNANAKQLVESIREAAARNNSHVAILGDLQGPKIRIGRFVENQIYLDNGQLFVIDVSLGLYSGNQQKVGCDYKALTDDLSPGDVLLLDDGRVVLNVVNINPPRIECTVKSGGKLGNNKGINKYGGGLSASVFTEKDKEDIKTAIDLEIDYLAVSFPRSAADIQQARELLGEAGKDIGIIAKIERAEAVANDNTLSDIILASDAVMVARGDLGVEIGEPQLILVQKRIIYLARKLNRAVIIATQMMESMIESPQPTRAEVFDVANAVLDGTDAVMCSAETAIGKYPVETIETMVCCCIGAEHECLVPHINLIKHIKIQLKKRKKTIDETIARAAMYAANHLKGKGVAITITESESGRTIISSLSSRIRSRLPIVVLSSNPRTLRRMALYRCAFPQHFDGVNTVATYIEQHGLARKGDFVVLSDCNNVINIIKIGQGLRV